MSNQKLALTLLAALMVGFVIVRARYLPPPATS